MSTTELFSRKEFYDTLDGGLNITVYDNSSHSVYGSFWQIKDEVLEMYWGDFYVSIPVQDISSITIEDEDN